MYEAEYNGAVNKSLSSHGNKINEHHSRFIPDVLKSKRDLSLNGFVVQEINHDE